MCVNVMDRIRTNERKLHKGKRQRRVPNKCMMYWKKNATNIIVKMKAIDTILTSFFLHLSLSLSSPGVHDLFCPIYFLYVKCTSMFYQKFTTNPFHCH